MKSPAPRPGDPQRSRSQKAPSKPGDPVVRHQEALDPKTAKRKNPARIVTKQKNVVMEKNEGGTPRKERKPQSRSIESGEEGS